MYLLSGCSTTSNAELRKTGVKDLALWRDADIDGVSDPGEVTSLADNGIVALSCHHVVVTDENAMVAAYAPKGVTFRDGTTRPTYNLILRAMLN